ncbi:MAG: hypothetical protein FJW22_09675 [Acidimicrobiia bacterium]|nr:hypothetical protein [Acidimicrobiia bacterium]
MRDANYPVAVTALTTAVFCVGLLAAGTSAPETSAHAGQADARRVAVRNERPRPGQEVLVLRHQQLSKGAHEAYYRSSLAGVWPWYEKIGTRIVGQWLVIDPPGDASSDHAYRLARYASFEHWRATRDPANVGLGGNGPDREKSLESGRDRSGVQTGSKGAYFLQGEFAPTRPLYMPAVSEQYALVAGEAASAADALIAVRNGAAQQGTEIVELRYQRIDKGTFERFVADTRDAIWPWEEKLGARPIGQWRVIHPDAPNRTKPDPAFDEVVTLTRYASREHRLALQPDRAVLAGGNGPDWRAWRDALAAQAPLTRATEIEVMQGDMYLSPPVFLPPLNEKYRLAR